MSGARVTETLEKAPCVCKDPARNHDVEGCMFCPCLLSWADVLAASGVVDVVGVCDDTTTLNGVHVGYPHQERYFGYTVEPRVCCLTCRQNVAVMSSGRLRPHKGPSKNRNHRRGWMCDGAQAWPWVLVSELGRSNAGFPA